ADERPMIHNVDPFLLKQALNNILDNAVSACNGRQGEVVIKLKSTGSNIQISVSDNGTGIPEDQIDKVFTPFFSSKPSGTGLGLPLASKIIDLHGGHITVESKVGVGTTFRIHLPVKIGSESVTLSHP
ncbi:MAG: sensor histidine kinase, partial [Candidatus Zixiibacteriota bacterium]